MATIIAFPRTYKNVEFYKINHDTYGNPRYIIHTSDFAKTYEEAVKKAKKAGGAKYRNKRFGRYFVFQSYNIESTINELLAE